MPEVEHEVQRHSTMYLASSGGITLFGFLATIFYAHWVGADVLGQYMVFLSVLSILSLLCDFGTGYAASFRICQGKDTHQYFSAMLVIRLTLLALVSVALFFMGNAFIRIDDPTLIPVLIFVLGLSTITSAASVSLGASNRLGLAATVAFIDNGVRIFVQIILVFIGFAIYGLIGGVVAGLAAEIVIDLKYLDYHWTRFRREHVEQLFTFSGWAFLGTVCTTLFDNASILIISYFLSVADAGIYGVCWTFSVFTLFVSTALCNTLFVKVSRWNAAGDWNAITQSLSRATSYSLILAIPMLAGGVLLGKPLLYYLYGSTFTIGATALVIIIGARIIQSIFQLYSNFLMATNHVKQQFIGLLTGILVNICLACILIPIIGLPGAAVAALANVLISMIIARHFLKMTIPIHIDGRIIWDILIATGVMTLILVTAEYLIGEMTRETTGILVCLGAGIYCFVLLGLNKDLRADIFRLTKIRWIQ